MKKKTKLVKYVAYKVHRESQDLLVRPPWTVISSYIVQCNEISSLEKHHEENQVLYVSFLWFYSDLTVLRS